MKKIDTQTNIFSYKKTQIEDEQYAEINKFQQMLNNNEITPDEYKQLTSPSLYTTDIPLNQTTDEYSSITNQEEPYSAKIKAPFKPSYQTYKEENLAKKFYWILANHLHLH